MTSPTANKGPALPLVAVFAISWMIGEELLGAHLYVRYDLMQVVWCRYAAHLLLMIFVWGWWRPQLLWRTRRPWFQLSRSMLMLVMPLSFAFAVGLRTAADVVWAVFWITPLLILALARALIGERAPAVWWLLAGASVVAAVVVLRPSLEVTPAEFVWPTMMALSFSLYVVMTRSLRGETFQANLFYSALGVFLLLTLWMPAVWITPPLHDIALLAGIGIIGFVGLLALDRAADRAPVSSWAPALHLQVAAVAVFAWSIGGHTPAASGIVGLLAIVAIALYLWREESRRRLHAGSVAEQG